MGKRVDGRPAGLGRQQRPAHGGRTLGESRPAWLAALAAVTAVTGLLLGGAAVAEGDLRALTRPTTDFTAAEPFERQSAGAATLPSLTVEEIMHAGKVEVFSRPVSGLDDESAENFRRGNELFRQEWSSAEPPADSGVIYGNLGLGPLFNANSCVACHPNDGRGRTPYRDEVAVSLLMRLLQPPTSEGAGATTRPGDPIYGGQLQNAAIDGFAPEASVTVTYKERPIALGDGSTVSLREPFYSIVDPANGSVSDKTVISPRIAQQMVGLGLLEAINEADILAGADPEDADGDGISGTPAHTINPRTGQMELGRFGWRGESASIEHQVVNALLNDIGIATSLHPTRAGDCTSVQTDCLRLSQPAFPISAVEADDETVELIAFYSAVLGVPARRDLEKPAVMEGKRLFYEIGCTSCHTPKFVTSDNAPVAQLRGQLIWPYTDMLLHDMGPGLADQPHDPRGYSSEHAVPNLLSDSAPAPDRSLYDWRTPPLWGIGLTELVSGENRFLHDGRARSLTEAILWHAGEAKPARDRFAALPLADRRKLLAFLNSL